MSGIRADARKRAQEAAAKEIERYIGNPALSQQERTREVVRDALAEVYSGAGFIEADALLDQLADLGARVEVA